MSDLPRVGVQIWPQGTIIGHGAVARWGSRTPGNPELVIPMALSMGDEPMTQFMAVSTCEHADKPWRTMINHVIGQWNTLLLGFLHFSLVFNLPNWVKFDLLFCYLAGLMQPWNCCGTEVQTRPYFWLRCCCFQSRVWGLMDNHIPGIAYPSWFVCAIQIPVASQIQGVWLISSTVDGFHSILPHQTDWNVHKKLSHVFLTAQTHWKSTAEPWIETPIPSYYTDRQIGLPLVASPPILYLATNHHLYQFPLHIFDGWSLKLVRNPLLNGGFSPSLR